MLVFPTLNTEEFQLYEMIKQLEWSPFDYSQTTWSSINFKNQRMYQIGKIS